MSRLLRWVSLTHTMRLHAHYHTAGEGHLYQGRFKSFPIQDDAHFLAVCRYVERNALRAGLVEHAEDWRWGSLFRWHARPEPEPRLLTPWPIPRSPRLAGDGDENWHEDNADCAFINCLDGSFVWLWIAIQESQVKAQSLYLTIGK